MKDKEVPKGVKIIGWSFFIIGILGLLSIPLIILGLMSMEPLNIWPYFLIPISILTIVSGWKINKGKPWARKVIITLSSIYVLASANGLIWYIISLLNPAYVVDINKIILWVNYVIYIVAYHLHPLEPIFSMDLYLLPYTISLVKVPLYLIIYGFILGYLLFSSKAKEFFKN